MRSQTLASLLLLAAAPLATAAPQNQPAYPYDVSNAPNRTPPTWRRLSDAIIRKIWSLPNTQKSLRDDDSSSAHEAATEQFVSRYGDDVVLRFKIRTAEEAKALAEASDILFLDVWEFNDDWADIRVAKDVVSSCTRLPMLHD
jgi:extracellular matrix protein 14